MSLAASCTVASVRCGVCGSERLSPFGELRSEQKYYGTLRLMFKRPGILKPRPTFDAAFARACRDCGAVLPFLGERTRRLLDATADELADVDGSNRNEQGSN